MSAPDPSKVFPPPCKLPASLDGADQVPDKKEGEGVKMKKELGLLEGVSIILGIIMGSGLYTNTMFCLTSTLLTFLNSWQEYLFPLKESLKMQAPLDSLWLFGFYAEYCH